MASATEEWRLAAAPAAAVARRRVLAVLVAIAGTTIGIALPVGVGLLAHLPSAGLWLVLPLLASAVWLATRMWNAPPRELPIATIRVPTRGVLRVEGVDHAIRSCFYDGAEELLWARGRLGFPLACLRVEPRTACEIVDALGCSERGLRTLDALPGVFGIPFVGTLLGFGLGCGVMFAVVMLAWGPLHVGAPAAAIALPLSVFGFRRARVELDDRALRWRWWSFARELPLASIEKVSATAETLRVTTRDGKLHRIRIRVVSSTVQMAGLDPWKARIAAFAAHVESRAVAAAFE